MRLIALRFLGTEVFAIEWGTPPTFNEGGELAGGTLSAMPMGFTPQWGDQRWQPGGEP